MAEKVDAFVQTDPVIITSCRKRTLENETDSINNKKSNSNVVLKMLIPNISVGGILGKKGEDIINAQQTSGAVAKISKVGEFYPGTNERICLISGDAESVIDFSVFVIGKIIITNDQWNDPTSLNKRPQVKLLVSNAAAGVIIGKNGKYVQEIKEASGVYIQLSQKVESNLISERCVVIGGTSTQLQVAIGKIVNAISQDSAFNSLPILNYVPKGPQAPLYTQSVWSTAIKPESYSETYGNSGLSKPQSISYTIDPNTTFTSGYDKTYRPVPNKMERVERSIEIPESIVGHILGKGGASIAELKSHTSTDIKISKKGVYAPTTTNRIATITGFSPNVEYALRIVTESLQNEERRRTMADQAKQIIPQNGNFF